MLKKLYVHEKTTKERFTIRKDKGVRHYPIKHPHWCNGVSTGKPHKPVLMRRNGYAISGNHKLGSTKCKVCGRHSTFGKKG